MGLLYKRSKLLNSILDSLEDQEGGAMYISCDVANGGPVEPEMGYVPNNPLFGLALDSPQQDCAAASCVGCLSCQGSTALPISSLTANDFVDCGSCFDPSTHTSNTAASAVSAASVGIILESAQIHSSDEQHHHHHQDHLVIDNSEACNANNLGGIVVDNSSSNFWGTDEMASAFPGLPPLDIDPLPSLFPFSPCGASYNFSTNPHQPSLSYTVHPHQMLLSPNGSSHSQAQFSSGQQITHGGSSHGHGHGHAHGHGHGSPLSSSSAAALAAQSCYYDASPSTMQVASNANCNQHFNVSNSSPSSAAVQPPPPPPHAMYPSMSVNVSMNMTMHGYGAESAAMPMQCPQMQWTPPNTSSAVNVLYPPLLSPTHYPAAATYSFTADFRTPNLQPSQSPVNVLPALTEPLEKNSPSPTLTPRSFYASAQAIQSYSPPAKSPVYTPTRESTKSFSSGGNVTTYEDDDSNEGSSDTKPNLCRLCGKTYARPSTLKTHLRTHSGERPYRCPDCNKSFSQAANLTAHVRTHTGQKPFRCPICDRRFSQSSSVTTHMRTHSGERPYRCSSCKKSFSDSSTLTKHLRIHSGEKPYQCKLCFLRFSQSGNLNRHMRVHGGHNNGNILT